MLKSWENNEMEEISLVAPPQQTNAIKLLVSRDKPAQPLYVACEVVWKTSVWLAV